MPWALLQRAARALWPARGAVPAPRLVEHDGLLDLRFENGVGQSRMDPAAPDRLVVDYTRTMLAALLWQPAPAVIGVVGLGGGSQVKFLHRWLPRARIEVIEVNPQVLALRGRFKVPPDDDRLQVHQGDALGFLPRRAGVYDLLLLDAYDTSGIPAALSTAAFYRSCRDALAPGGVMACNLFCAGHAAHVRRLQEVFERRVLVVEESHQSNRVAFAWRDRLPTGWQPEPMRLLDALPDVARGQLRDPVMRVASLLRTSGH